MIDYKNSKTKRFRYLFIIIDNFSKYFCCIPLKNKSSKRITEEFSNILLTSKTIATQNRKRQRSGIFHTIFQNFFKSKNIQPYSRFTDKGPSIAERVLRTIRSLLKNAMFEKGNADWLSELPSVNKKHKNTIHRFI